MLSAVAFLLVARGCGVCVVDVCCFGVGKAASCYYVVARCVVLVVCCCCLLFLVCRLLDVANCWLCVAGSSFVGVWFVLCVVVR